MSITADYFSVNNNARRTTQLLQLRNVYLHLNDKWHKRRQRVREGQRYLINSDHEQARTNLDRFVLTIVTKFICYQGNGGDHETKHAEGGRGVFAWEDVGVGRSWWDCPCACYDCTEHWYTFLHWARTWCILLQIAKELCQAVRLSGGH